MQKIADEDFNLKFHSTKCNAFSMGYSKDQLTDFYTNGYIVCKGLINQDILTAAIKHISNLYILT